MVNRDGFSRYYGSHFNRLAYHFDIFCSRRSTIVLLYFNYHLSRQLWALRCLRLLVLIENVGGAIAVTAFTSRHIGRKNHRLLSLLGRLVGDNKVNCPVEKRKAKETGARRNVDNPGFSTNMTGHRRLGGSPAQSCQVTNSTRAYTHHVLVPLSFAVQQNSGLLTSTHGDVKWFDIMNCGG